MPFRQVGSNVQNILENFAGNLYQNTETIEKVLDEPEQHVRLIVENFIANKNAIFSNENLNLNGFANNALKNLIIFFVLV